MTTQRTPNAHRRIEIDLECHETLVRGEDEDPANHQHELLPDAGLSRHDAGGNLWAGMCTIFLYVCIYKNISCMCIYACVLHTVSCMDPAHHQHELLPDAGLSRHDAGGSQFLGVCVHYTLVCVCVCLYVSCKYVCIHVYMHTGVYVCMHLRMYVCMHTHTHIQAVKKA